MAFRSATPRDRSLKSQRLFQYLRVLRAAYQLRGEGKHVVGWSLLAERSGLPENEVSEAALDLRTSGFFDTESREIGRVALTQHQASQGWLRSWGRITAHFIKLSRSWQLASAVGAGIVAVVLWLTGNLAYDVLKWVVGWLTG